MNDSAQELKKTRQKVRDYYRTHPGADRLPETLARELETRTRDCVAYEEEQRRATA